MTDYIDKERVLFFLPRPDDCETGDLYDYRDMIAKNINETSPAPVLFYTFKKGVLTISVPYGMEIEEVHAEECMGWTVSKLSRFLPAGKITF